MVEPELIDLLGYSRKRLLPTRILPLDRSTLVSAERVRKSIDLNLSKAIPHGALYHSRSKPDLVVLGQAKGSTQLFDQDALFSVGGCRQADVLFGLFGLSNGNLLLSRLSRGQQFVDVLGHGRASFECVLPVAKVPLSSASNRPFDQDQVL